MVNPKVSVYVDSLHTVGMTSYGVVKFIEVHEPSAHAFLLLATPW